MQILKARTTKDGDLGRISANGSLRNLKGFSRSFEEDGDDIIVAAVVDVDADSARVFEKS